METKSRKPAKAKLSKDCACYVLITCGKPSKTGEMQVAMSYEGDEVLASYLIHGAQQMLDEKQATSNEPPILFF